MNVRLAFYLVIFLAHSFTIPPVSLGQFDQIRKSVNTPNSNSDCDDDDDHDHHHHGYGYYHHDHDHDDDSFGDLVGTLIFGLIAAPFQDSSVEYDIQYYDYDDPNDLRRLPRDSDHPLPDMATLYFARYPYADYADGMMLYPNNVPQRMRMSSKRISFEFGSDYDDIDRYTTRFMIESHSGFGWDLDWNYFTQRLAPGVQDNLKVGDVNFTYRFVEMEKLLWRLGVGVNWFDSHRVNEYGLNLTTKVDFFPVKPIVVSGEVDWGSLGGAEMFHGNISTGVILDRVELFGGYDYRKIDDIELEGPMFGIRLWW